MVTRVLPQALTCVTVAALAASLGLASDASAKTVTPSATGSINAWVSGPYRTGTRLYQLSGEPLRVTGQVWPLPTDGKAQIRIFVDGNQVRSSSVRITAKGTSGRFTYRTNVYKTGRLTVRVDVAKTVTSPEWTNYRLVPAVRVYSANVGFGSKGYGVGVLHSMLRGLGYWAPRGDTYSAGTGKAVLAFRKVNRMARIETPSHAIFRMLQHGKGMMGARHPELGLHWEGDLTRQVIGLFRGKRAVEVHVTSSGKPSTPTITGTYRFYMREPGTNSHGMVYSNYFHNGYAVHGYAELPTYAASHGCFRVWVPNAIHIYNLIHLGEAITVYH
jgi:L,D-transpeptidase catalytic domain